MKACVQPAAAVAVVLMRRASAAVALGLGISLGLGLALLLASPQAAAEDSNMLRDVDRLRWEHRLILVFADADRAGRAREALESAADAIDERHILWFVVAPGGVHSNFDGLLDPGLGPRLAHAYRRGAAEASAEVVLIGKDGGVKYRAGDLDLERIFAEIDGMPMRRREMREQ